MTSKQIAGGTVHSMPDDLAAALLEDHEAMAKWESLTPLARNEWICWTTFVKQEKTRNEHIIRVVSELLEGMRRPCCWIGCPHRTDKPVSKSVAGILAKKKRASSRTL